MAESPRVAEIRERLSRAERLRELGALADARGGAAHAPVPAPGDSDAGRVNHPHRFDRPVPTYFDRRDGRA